MEKYQGCWRGVKDAIAFVERYQNWAWGYQCNGSFIDCRSNVYEFDCSDREQGISGEAFQQALWETYCNTKPVQRKNYAIIMMRSRGLIIIIS